MSFVVVADFLVVEDVMPTMEHMQKELEQCKINTQVDQIFIDAYDTIFMDGMDSIFSRDLQSIIQKYGNKAITGIEWAILKFEKTRPDLASETLRQIGSNTHQATHQNRLRVLTDNLESPDPRIRDAAGIGIAAMDDTKAIWYIRQAIEREKSIPLQHNLELVLKQLLAKIPTNPLY